MMNWKDVEGSNHGLQIEEIHAKAVSIAGILAKN
jgi:hypothetical protein